MFVKNLTMIDPAKILFFFLLLSVFYSCSTDDVSVTVEVMTKEVTNVTPGGALLNGNLEMEGGTIEISDYGFILSQSEISTIENAEHIFSLGSIDKTSIFRQEVSGLEVAKQYFVTSYYTENGSVQYGETLSFMTVELAISTILPQSGVVGSDIVVSINLDGIDLEEVRVLFGDLESEEFDYDNTLQELTAEVPFGFCGEVEVKVDVLGQSAIASDPFNIVEWETTLITNFFGVEHAFTIGDVAYFKSISIASSNFWGFDVSTGQELLTLAEYEVSSNHGVTFEVGGKGYIGLGNSTSEIKGIFEYDPEIDNWTRKNDFPGNVRFGSTGFSFQDKAYVLFGGHSTDITNNTVWEYASLGDSWSSIGTFPGFNRYYATHFVLDNFAYVGLGVKIEADAESVPLSDFWRYDMANNEWLQMNDFPGGSRNNAQGFARNGKGYVGLGDDFASDIWEFDPATGEWSLFSNLDEPRTEAVGFAVNDRIFAGFGKREGSNGLSLDILEQISCQ